MANQDMVVSVRIPEANLRQLQLLARVYDESVGSLIRTAVNKHIFELVNRSDFKNKAEEMQRSYGETLRELFKPATPSPTRKRSKKK
ncbi:MAG: hypothetical protein HY505_01935 [Candidatus Yanofskybacteria bacterium]|nr:hypothetical protein [Candidatus Yanofskybacteria bacterium]